MCESPEYYSINIEALSKLHTQPPKDSSISFTVRLAVNDNSDASNGIPASDVPCCGVAVRFAAGRYPKLQSFVAANHSKWKDLILLVGGRTAGLHGLSGSKSKFSKEDQNYALFVLNMATNVTMAAKVPLNLQESLGVMNAQSQQVVKSGKNYLFLVGGYGWSNSAAKNITSKLLSVINVDEVIDSIEAAATSQPPTIPPISKFVQQTSHDSFQITGGEMLFVPGNPSASTPNVDTFHLIVGQYFEGNYGGGPVNNIFKYTKSAMMFVVPYPDGNGSIPPAIEVTAVHACNSAIDLSHKSSIDSQLARRDLNVVPTFLPNSYDATTKTALPGALILSGVFQQDGSNAPYLQPIIFSFNQGYTPVPGRSDPVPSFTVGSFFQLYNNYNCANVQLFSARDKAMYNVLFGGVSYFYSSDAGVVDQASSLFKAPFTSDASILKQDNDGNFTQVLCPKSKDFFDSTKITTFGTVALFIPDQRLPINHANLSQIVFDLDAIRANANGPVRLGSIFGGIESSEVTGFPPWFDPAKTVASSRLIDAYLELL